MSQALMNFLGQSLGKGQATGGTKTTLLDTRKVFVDGMLNGRIIRMTIGGIDYYRTITGTTASTSTITFPTLPGTPASCAWTAVAGHVITTTSVADGGNDYTIVAALAVGKNKPLAVTLVGNVITIALATGAGGASNDAANTTTLVAAAIDALAEFTSSVTSGGGSGVVAATSAPVAFSGGVDEVKPVSGTHYEVVGGIGSAVSLSGSNVEQDGSLKTTMTTALDSDYDSINVDKMGKGGVTTVHSAIADTATSDEVDCRGYNAVLIEVAISAEAKLWTFKVQGCMVSGGTFVDWYEMANTGTMNLMSYQTNTSKGWVFKGIPDYIKIVATEDEDTATCTVKVQPLNL